MSNKKVQQFLPKVFQTNKIKNFMDSTTETLFSKQNSEEIPYFIGKTPGGLFDPLNDYYASEIRKIREDYQLEPTLIFRDLDTREVTNTHFYEDLLNNLRTDGSFVNDHSRLFQSDTYSYAPPIDMDMFVNFTNYYWYPEGVAPLRVNANPSDIIGSIEYQAELIETNTAEMLSSGQHILLNNDKEYIVEGVGRYIKLIEFSVEKNLPKRIDRMQEMNVGDASLGDRFPLEYITIERGAADENPWSRNNAWYHRDVIDLSKVDEGFRSQWTTRQAKRPIVAFRKDIELYNYSQKPFEYVRLFGDSLNVAIDNVIVRTNDLVVEQNNPTIRRFDGNNFVAHSVAEHDDKITIMEGDRKADEMKWDADAGAWEFCQLKVRPTQAPLFNMYDSADGSSTALHDPFKYPNSDFEGSKIFSYLTDIENGLIDPVLNLPIVYKAFQEQSDIVFSNFMNTEYSYSISSETNTISTYFYKIFNEDELEQNNTLLFTVHKEDNGSTDHTIFVNNDKLPNLILKGGTQYRFDFSDTTSTPRGWRDVYTPIEILNSVGVRVTNRTHADSSRNRITLSLKHNITDPTKNEYIYTDGVHRGRIIIVDQTVDSVLYQDSWLKHTDRMARLTQKKSFIDEDIGDYKFTFEYIPKNDHFIIRYNGEVLPPSRFTYENGDIRLIGSPFQRGDYMEVSYETFQEVTHTDHIIQDIHSSLSNNPFNEEAVRFAFSEIFNHFRSIIGNQIYITGSSLSDNNFRDTLKDGSRGDTIVRHENPMIPLLFANTDDTTNVVKAITFAMDAYQSYKNLLILKTEEQIGDRDITPLTAKDVFDDIMSILNNGKTVNDMFSKSFMLATHRKFLTVQHNNGVLDTYIDLALPNNTFYVYTLDGLKVVDVDFTLDSDPLSEQTVINPISFNINDIHLMRYYEDMEPSFCPPTPAKFGLEKPTLPLIALDTTHSSDRYFVIGHDGSRTLAYSSNEDIANGDYDGRDLILLEFERRIFNGINPDFKGAGVNAIDYRAMKEGKFRTTPYRLEELQQVEFNLFHIWVYNNNIDYTNNTSFRDAEAFTFNYSGNTDADGAPLAGHWKGIFEYYYDTFTPGTTPWEMLGFKIRPNWWESEYGSDYSSNNSQLWEDLEEGIIRQGILKNTDFLEYKNASNPYSRPGLSQYIPVDANAAIRSPIEIGITDEPAFLDSTRPWQYGDMSPVEQAWKNSSMYGFAKQITYYLLNPLNYISKSWNTDLTFNVRKSFSEKPMDFLSHNVRENRYVPGVSQWIHDRLVSDNQSVQDILVDSYIGIDVVLAHKVGGYIDTENLRVITESFNPRSKETSAAIPTEDISVILHQSKNILEETYSGVLIERIDPQSENINFEAGILYGSDDVVFRIEDSNYYKNVRSIFNIAQWNAPTSYVVGRSIRYGDRAYRCIKDHLSRPETPEESPDYWEMRDFEDSDWAMLMGKPNARKTQFKVYGYDLYTPAFKVNPKLNSGQTRRIEAATNKTSQINVRRWEPNTEYKRGEYVKLDGGQVQRSIADHRSGIGFDNLKWTRVSDTPFENMAQTSVTIDGSPNAVEVIPYGTIFKTEQEVAEFLMGYSRYLESRGWIFDEYDSGRGEYKNWTLSIKEFIKWAFENKSKGSVISLSPASMRVKYKTDHGVPSISRDFDSNQITLMDNRSRIIAPSEVEIMRLNGIFTIDTDRPIYYTRLNVREYEHIIVFNNKTIFSDILYDPLYGIRKDRLSISARKTKDWNGKMTAEGFIISGNKLLPNFETSVSDLKTIADIGEISTKDILNVLKYHNYGYERRSYLQDIEMDDKAQIAFYSGFIKQKGTNDAFQRILRSDVLAADGELTVNEEWAFKEGEFGAIVNNQMIELSMNRTEFTTSPQPLFLEYKSTFDDKSSNNIYFNKNEKNRWLVTPSRFAENGNIWSETRLKDVKKMPTAGYVKFSDTTYRAFELSHLNRAIRASGRTVEEHQIAWVAKDTREEYGFNVYTAQKDHTVSITEIITPGLENTSSFIVRADNVDESEIYGFYTGASIATFMFKRIDPNNSMYIALPFSNNEYNVIDDTLTEDQLNDIGFFIWKSTRVNKYYETIHDDIHDTLDGFISNHNLDVYQGMKVYIDDSRGEGSYKEATLTLDPLEYWTFNTYENDEYIGEMGVANMIPDNLNDFSGQVKGLLFGTTGISGNDTYNPMVHTNGAEWPEDFALGGEYEWDEFNTVPDDQNAYQEGLWPSALWSDLDRVEEHGSTSLMFWFNNDAEFVYQYSKAVSTTIASMVLGDIKSGEVVSVQLMVCPPIIGSEWSYQIGYMKNSVVIKTHNIDFLKGYNQVVIELFNDTEHHQVEISTTLNGSIYDSFITDASPKPIDYLDSTQITVEKPYVYTWDTTQRFGFADIPDQTPVITSPSGGAENVGLTPTVTSSAFVESPDTHRASYWEVYEGGVLVHTSGKTNSLTSYTIPTGVLQAGKKTYAVRVQYEGGNNRLSTFSKLVSFTTITMQCVYQPSIVSPVEGEQLLDDAPIFASSEFKAFAYITDVHVASYWEVLLDGDIVYESGRTTSDLTIHALPVGVLAKGGTTYSVRVKHEGTQLGVSNFSNAVRFIADASEEYEWDDEDSNLSGFNDVDYEWDDEDSNLSGFNDVDYEWDDEDSNFSGFNDVDYEWDYDNDAI